MTDIIIPRHQDIIVQTRSNAGVAGRYKLTKGKNRGYIDANSGLWIPGPDVVTGETGWFDNLITNYGLNQLATSTVAIQTTYSHVGTGTTAEANSDTSLVTHTNASNDLETENTTAESSAPYFGSHITTIRHDEGDAEGNIAEVGMSAGATNANMFSRARVVDGGGSPTTIAVQSDEWLDVAYEFRIYPDHINSDGSANDGSGTIDISGVSYGYTIRPAFITNASYLNASNGGAAGSLIGGAYGCRTYGTGASLGAASSEPTGATGVSRSNIGAGQAYSADTYTRDSIWTFGLGDANHAGPPEGVQALMIYTGQGAYQILFGTIVPKTSSKVWTYEHTIAWARATIS